jgi:hypothetical protein
VLGFVMLAMDLQLRDFAALLYDKPLSVRDRITSLSPHVQTHPSLDS